MDPSPCSFTLALPVAATWPRFDQLCQSHKPNNTVVHSADCVESMLLLVCCGPNQDLVQQGIQGCAFVPGADTCLWCCCELFEYCFKQFDPDVCFWTVCLFLQDADLLALVAAAQIAVVLSSLQAPPKVGVRGDRRASRKSLSGITAEHMLFWVLQADIAVQLRCGNSAGVVSMSQEPDDAAAILEAGNAAVATFGLCHYQRQLKSSWHPNNIK